MKRRPSLGGLRLRGRSREGEGGQALVLFAGGLSVLLVAAGLVVDGGSAFQNRRQAQNDADLAALAGTQSIADYYTGGGSGGQVWDTIAQSMAANDCSATGSVPCTWTAAYIRPVGGSEIQLGSVTQGGSIPAGAQGVVVNVHREPETFFLGLIDQDTWDVNAEASGITARPGGLPAGQVLPIAVDPPHNNFQPNSIYELTAGKDAPGNFSWLSWYGSNSPKDLGDSICDPSNPALTFPAVVKGDPGKSNGVRVRQCVGEWVANGQTVLLPMWEKVEGQGNNTYYTIVGLGAFVLVDVGQPVIDSITGRFVEYYPLPGIGANWGGPPCAVTEPCGRQTTFIGLTR